MNTELASTYFLSDDVQKNRLRPQLVSQTHSSVSILVDTALSLCGKYSARRELTRYSKDQLPQAELPWWIWIDCVANPMIVDIFEVIQSAGDNALDPLIRIVSEFKSNRQLVALLVFLKHKTISARTSQQLKDILKRCLTMRRSGSLQDEEATMLTYALVLIMSRGPLDKEFLEIRHTIAREVFEGNETSYASKIRSMMLLKIYNSA